MTIFSARTFVRAKKILKFEGIEASGDVHRGFARTVVALQNRYFW